MVEPISGAGQASLFFSFGWREGRGDVTLTNGRLTSMLRLCSFFWCSGCLLIFDDQLSVSRLDGLGLWCTR